MYAVLVAVFACAAGLFTWHRTLKAFAFTAWVFTFVAASMVWPNAFATWGGYDLKNLVVPLVQIIMFGMGTKLSVSDFVRVLVIPWPVFIGVAFHYCVMPITGFLLAKLFGFPPEIAAGVILIGSVSSGAASNLIAYLAGANVALAVTVTACSTLLSPIMTPFLMKTLAGRLVPIDFLKMVLEILNMVIVPVASGLIANRILYCGRPWASSLKTLGLIVLGGVGTTALMTSLSPGQFGTFAPLRSGAMVGVALISLVALTKLIVNVYLDRQSRWMDRVLPLVSMAGICFIIAIITSRSREKLLTVGIALIMAAILHNAIGYFLGYWLARAIRLDEITCRTIAIEVGMQNGGMASGLAMAVLKSADAALAPAIFGPWMNISGSILASWWRKRPVPETGQPRQPSEAQQTG